MLTPKRQPSDEPDRGADDAPERRRGIFRWIFARSNDPERQLARLLDDHRRELDEHAARFQERLDDLEHREEQMRDQRVSVERLLRRGTKDLDLRETELVELGRELMARESRLHEEEVDLQRRRGELGAVELKRAAIERRERAIAAREAELVEDELAPAEPEQGPEPAEEPPSEPDLLRTPAGDPRAERILLFVPGRAYQLVEVDHVPLEAGVELRLNGENYVVARVGPSPLPGDGRRCAYLVRGSSREASGGSS